MAASTRYPSQEHGAWQRLDGVATPACKKILLFRVNTLMATWTIEIRVRRHKCRYSMLNRCVALRALYIVLRDVG